MCRTGSESESEQRAITVTEVVAVRTEPLADGVETFERRPWQVSRLHRRRWPSGSHCSGLLAARADTSRRHAELATCTTQCYYVLVVNNAE